MQILTVEKKNLNNFLIKKKQHFVSNKVFINRKNTANLLVWK